MKTKIYTVLNIEPIQLEIKAYNFFDKEKAKKKYDELLSELAKEFEDFTDVEIEDYLRVVENEIQN